MKRNPDLLSERELVLQLCRINIGCSTRRVRGDADRSGSKRFPIIRISELSARGFLLAFIRSFLHYTLIYDIHIHNNALSDIFYDRSHKRYLQKRSSLRNVINFKS